MAIDSLESGPERVRTAVGEFYHNTMIDHDGEFASAVLGVPSDEEALLFILGRLEDYDINHGKKEALALVRCEITNALKSVEETEHRSYLRENLWDPALEAAKIEQESFGAFQGIRRAVHLYDNAEATLAIGGAEKILEDLGPQ